MSSPQSKASSIALGSDYEEIREAVRRICARFPEPTGVTPRRARPIPRSSSAPLPRRAFSRC